MAGCRIANTPPINVVDTIDPMLPPVPEGDGAAEPIPPDDEAPRPRRRVWFVLGCVVVLLTLGTIAAAFVKVPYFLLAPGSVRSTEGLVSVEGAPSYESEGQIDFTTVSIKQATALQAVVGWLDPTVDVIEEEKILGGRSQDENRDLNLQEMADSKEVATAVALERLGYDVTEQGSGALIVDVVPDVPAAAVLSQGDVITAADGQPIQLSRDLIDIIASHQPGDVVMLDVMHPSRETAAIPVELVARPDEPDKAMLGVSLETFRLRYEFPFDVTIDSGAVGGPSAGLAFTLGVIDVLTPGSLTGGQRIATTGTMDPSGDVGPVGGVQQKTVAVRRAGATLFLVPPKELDEARKYAGDMRVEPVETVDDALRVLATIGGGTDAVEIAASPGS
jgi:PDZ domain-containing protein